MRENSNNDFSEFQHEIDLIERYNQGIRFDQYSYELSFDSNFLSWPQDFQRPISDQNHTALPLLQNKPKTNQNHANQDTTHLIHKNTQSQGFQYMESFNQSQNSQEASSLNLNIKLFNQTPKSRIKEEIKTFPNFIFRTFFRRLQEYEHLYSNNDGLRSLKKFLQDNYGSKHYTLEQISKLFKDQTNWNCKLNRAILYQMLHRSKYTDIFKNLQRKKKKTYLIMTKVFQLRCKSPLLCSRVQCQ